MASIATTAAPLKDWEKPVLKPLLKDADNVESNFGTGGDYAFSEQTS